MPLVLARASALSLSQSLSLYLDAARAAQSGDAEDDDDDELAPFILTTLETSWSHDQHFQPNEVWTFQHEDERYTLAHLSLSSLFVCGFI